MANPVTELPPVETAQPTATPTAEGGVGASGTGATALPPASPGQPGQMKVPGGPSRRGRSPDREGAREWRWQWVLLPVLVTLILGVTVFFLWATKSQLDALQTQIYTAPRVRLDSLFAAVGSQTAGWDPARRTEYVQWRTRAELEAFALERRYHQANVLLMVRTWTRYLGFVTGMIMALMGAGFILGKFREAGTTLDVKTSPATAALSTTSPGLFLAVLGTALMITTIVVHTDIVTNDVPMYTGTYVAPGETGEATVPAAYPGGGAQAGATPDQILGRHGLGGTPAVTDSAQRSGRTKP